ncbi:MULTISPECIES: hypothetical protein [unclassified Synechococcus]|uniref:hypothetical protein n=1 Tax=unclassified Synechococcus TaxID=2626047 RepID=UPI002880A35F|nr:MULTISPECIES: hypothetical protein [unclassified Synechococcus]
MSSQPKLPIQTRGSPAALLRQPAGLGGDLIRQSPLQLRQGQQGGGGVDAEGIGLDGAHIPAAAAMLEGHGPEGAGEELGRQGRGDHQPPVGLPRRQGQQHRSHPRAMAIAVATDTGVDQHGTAWACSTSVCS